MHFTPPAWLSDHLDTVLPHDRRLLPWKNGRSRDACLIIAQQFSPFAARWRMARNVRRKLANGGYHKWENWITFRAAAAEPSGIWRVVKWADGPTPAWWHRTPPTRRQRLIKFILLMRIDRAHQQHEDSRPCRPAGPDRPTTLTITLPASVTPPRRRRGASRLTAPYRLSLRTLTSSVLSIVQSEKRPCYCRLGILSKDAIRHFLPVPCPALGLLQPGSHQRPSWTNHWRLSWQSQKRLDPVNNKITDLVTCDVSFVLIGYRCLWQP